MSNIRSILIFILFIIGISMSFNFASAQTDAERIAELKIQIQQLELEAQKYKEGIASEQAEAKTLKAEIAGLQKQISNLELQITLTGKKIDKTNIEISDVENSIFETQKNIDYRKSSIGELLLYLDKSDNEPLVASLLKNVNLSDFLRQDQYAKTVTSNLLSLVEELKIDKQNLEKDKDDMENLKSDLESLKKNQTGQKISLGGVKTNKNTLLAQTKGEEARYQAMLLDVQKRETAFFIELKQLENEIIQGGLYIIHITATTLPPKKQHIFSWPENNYRLTQGYGMTAYAKKGAYGGSPHNGIDMAAGTGTPIMAIGDGQIVANGYNNGWGNWAAINHTAYNVVSIYGHMSYLSPLKVGTNVTRGQVIGYEGNTGNSTGSHLHLSIYKDFFTYVRNKNGKDELYFNYFEGSINPFDYL